ncbi:MAG: alpha/beta hydrolase [Bacteroidota bacterium]
MNKLSFRDAKVAYKVEGKGTPVVLLHGFCEDHQVWEDFKQDLLEEKYRVITIDLPGFGQSEVVRPVSIKYYAETVLAVLDEKKLNEVILVGHSMGGYTALAVAELAPERIQGLGLFHSHPYADSKAKQEARHKQANFIRRQGHQLYVKQLVPKLFPAKYGLSHPFDLDKLIHRAARYEAEGIIAGLEAMANRLDRTAVLRQAKVPVLFIVGEEDTAVPPEASRDQLSLPAVAQIHVLENVGHMGMIEARRKTQLMVRQFVEFCLQS